MENTIIDLTRDDGDQDVAPSGKRSAAGAAAAQASAKRLCVAPSAAPKATPRPQQPQESRRSFINRIESSVAQLDKDALVELVMVLAEQRQEAMNVVVAFLKDEAAAGGAPPIPDDVAAEAAVKELMAAVREAKQRAEERCGTKYHLIDEGSPVVDLVVKFMEEEVVPLAPGAPQLEMLLGAFRAITSYSEEGKNYDVEPRGSNTVLQIDQLACACINALAPRAAEPAVKILLQHVNEIDMARINHGATVGPRTQLKHNWAPLRPTGHAARGLIAEVGRLEPRVSPTAARAVPQQAVPATSPATASSTAGRPSAAARSSSNGHIPLVCSNLDASLEFYQGLLGLERCRDRPDHKLPYRGAWLWIGSQMIQMMEFPNKTASDATAAQPGPADRHFRIAVPDLKPIVAKLEATGVRYARAAPDAPLVEIRDPDLNVVEVVEASSLRAR